MGPAGQDAAASIQSATHSLRSFQTRKEPVYKMNTDVQTLFLQTKQDAVQLYI